MSPRRTIIPQDHLQRHHHSNLALTESSPRTQNLSSQQIASDDSQISFTFADSTQFNPAVRQGLQSIVPASALGLEHHLSTAHSGMLSIQSSDPSSRIQAQMAAANPRMQDLVLPSYLIPGAQEAYLTAQMHRNTPDYAWTNGQSLPIHSSPSSIDRSLSHAQHYPSCHLSPGYHTQPASHSQGYCHSSPQYPSTHPSTHPSIRQNQSRSPSIAHSFPSNSAPRSPPTLSDQQQAFLSSSPLYLINQPGYYLPEASSLPIRSHSIPITPNSQALMTAETTYSSPESSHAASEPDHQVRVISSRPKPQCWDHGCNGREFSTFSNLLRHQREKSGVVAKAECPICGAVFTRSTARNIHVAQGKCKGGGGSGRESPGNDTF